MVERGPATEDDMVLDFLRAEIDSSRYSNCILAKLALLGIPRSLIDAPDLTNPLENGLRRCLMSYRGYDSRQGLFTGFPIDVTWRRVDLDPGDFQTMKYINDTVTLTPNWTEFSSRKRLVSDGARNFPRYSSDQRFRHIADMAHAIRGGKCFPPLVAVQHHEAI